LHRPEVEGHFSELRNVTDLSPLKICHLWSFWLPTNSNCRHVTAGKEIDLSQNGHILVKFTHPKARAAGQCSWQDACVGPYLLSSKAGRHSA
ncbi:MAG: hypothetical protein WAL52_07115, partial [Candidatus Sulfotelmatobacter sp.]